jgi:tetratricopeptide (TPR) repeat protein
LSGRCDPPSSESEQRIAGTFAYMAPEQRQGQAALWGVATDVYALGAILYDLLCGTLSGIVTESPSRATSPDVPVAPARPSLPDAPADLNAICQKCLCIEPSLRYESANELGADLHRFLRHEPVSARNAPWMERVGRWSRRRPAVAALCCLLAVTTVVSLTAITHLWRRAEANLAKLRAEQAVHAETSNRMRRALLNFTWLTQESRLQHVPHAAEHDAELRLLRDFYRDMVGWKGTSADNVTLDAALRAAGHSLAVAEGMEKLDRRQLNEEFAAGLEAWQSVIAVEPKKPEWRRALALHLFTYAASFEERKWLWWPESDRERVAIDQVAVQLLVEPYALLLVEFARNRPAFQNHATAYGMLRAAIAILEEREAAADVESDRGRALLIAYNQLSVAAHALGKRDESQHALEKAEALAAAAPPADECRPLLALAVAETHRIRARSLSRNLEVAGALAELQQSAGYYERAIEALPHDASPRLTLAGLRQRIASLHVTLQEPDLAVAELRAGIAVLTAGLDHTPGHRGLAQRRAALLYSLACCLIDAGDKLAAQSCLENAASEFGRLQLRNDDSRNKWMRAIRTWQTLGRLYADQGRADDAVSAYRQSLELLEGIRPRRGNTAQFKEYALLSQNALGQLLASAPSQDKPTRE